LSQVYENFEYILVDGASTDGTMTIVNRYRDRISKIISERDRGIYDAMNKGILAATGDVIGILNSDDLLQNENILSQVAESFAQNEVEALYGDLVYVQREDPQKVVRYWRSGQYRPGLFERGWMPPHPTFYVKKEIFNQYGAYDLSFPLTADYELMLRYMVKHQIKTVYLPEIMVRMRLGGISNRSLSSLIKNYQENILAWKKNGLKLKIGTIFLKRFRKLSQFFSR
jgi:glycosyltransferase involved in cell wall biosynthesis